MLRCQTQVLDLVITLTDVTLLTLKYTLGVRLTYETEVPEFITDKFCLIYHNFHNLARLFELFRRYIHVGNDFSDTKFVVKAQKVLDWKRNTIVLNVIIGF